MWTDFVERCFEVSGWNSHHMVSSIVNFFDSFEFKDLNFWNQKVSKITQKTRIFDYLGDLGNSKIKIIKFKADTKKRYLRFHWQFVEENLKRRSCEIGPH